MTVLKKDSHSSTRAQTSGGNASPMLPSASADLTPQSCSKEVRDRFFAGDVDAIFDWIRATSTLVENCGRVAFGVGWLLSALDFLLACLLAALNVLKAQPKRLKPKTSSPCRS